MLGEFGRKGKMVKTMTERKIWYITIDWYLTMVSTFQPCNHNLNNHYSQRQQYGYIPYELTQKRYS